MEEKQYLLLVVPVGAWRLVEKKKRRKRKNKKIWYHL